MSGPILQATGLSLRAEAAGGAPSRLLLDGIDLSLQSKELIGIYGESGSGKTTLGRALTNWLPANLAYAGGDISFAGRSIVTPGAAPDFRVGRDIAYIGSKPQSSLDPTQPVGVQIAEKLRCVRPEVTPAEARERVIQLLAEVRIPSPRERYHDYPTKYSGGMMQRAMIVDAICAEPAVLIADNITQPLDVTIAEQIVRLLADLCERRKMAVVFMASSLATLSRVAEKVAILHQGRFVESGLLADILRAPEAEYTRKVIAEVPRIWGDESAPQAVRKADDKPLMDVQDVHRTYMVRKRGHFNSYSRVQAVRGCSFRIMPRENFGIVGESGCGKSTLTRLLAWLEAPDKGDISLNGQALSSLVGDALLKKRQEFQLLLQDPYNSLPPRMAVGRMIAEGLLLRGGHSKADVEARVKKAMGEVGLPLSLYDKLPNSLSTGQRQRISIARALVLEPKLLILDETLSSLDQREQAKLIALFAELQAKNDLTYIFISHDMAMVRKVCTRIAVMYLGEIVELADNRSLFFEPKHPYTKALLSAVPTIEAKPFDAGQYLLEGEPPSPIDIAPGCSFASRCPWVFDKCRVENPRAVDTGGGNEAACHLLSGERRAEAV